MCVCGARWHLRLNLQLDVVVSAPRKIYHVSGGIVVAVVEVGGIRHLLIGSVFKNFSIL